MLSNKLSTELSGEVPDELSDELPAQLRASWQNRNGHRFQTGGGCVVRLHERGRRLGKVEVEEEVEILVRFRRGVGGRSRG